ncbi:MAG: class I adenylate-forming enzyme family protein [Gordonia sp. (in: high G+C Gram-positive bacteria)]|uniref:class I adenylate-forming enzyme family protein n=1 Tax=Gordonia sp. (in: high G+C Gram-positive bacteria) TaxID=84139 RepID=UPI003C776797
MIPHLPTVPDYLAHWAQHTPDAPAVVYRDQTLTYAELAVEVDRVAAALLASGVRPGDRVAVLANPSRTFWLTFLGSLSIGAVWLGLNPKYRLPELAYNVDNSRPSLLIGMGRFGDQDFAPTLSALAAPHGLSPIVFDAPAAEGAEDWDSFLARGAAVDAAALAAAREGIRADSPALIVYTSGSTGRPKGAVLGHGGLARSFEIQAHRAPVAPLRVVANLPINHIGGVGDLCCTPLIQGGTIVFQDVFDARAMLDSVAEYGVNAFMQVPTTLKILFERPDIDSFDLSGLRYVSWGGGPLPADIIRRLRSRDLHVGTTYGMTEITGSVTYSDLDADVEQLANTVGRPIPDIEFRLVDEHGDEVAPGQTGEVLVKHPGLLLEYFDNPAATADSFTADGFFATGDVGLIRADGNMQLVARTKEIFKSGGYNTYPREIELVLEEHPAVRLAAVVPVKHPVFDEVGIAYLEADPAQVGDDELAQWCRDRLANYKVPKGFVMMDALPLLPVGKVDRMALRAMAADRFADVFAS